MEPHIGVAQAEIMAGHAPDTQPAGTVTVGVSGQTECGPGEWLWPHGMTVQGSYPGQDATWQGLKAGSWTVDGHLHRTDFVHGEAIC